jgi:hypothetical protein
MLDRIGAVSPGALQTHGSAAGSNAQAATGGVSKRGGQRGSPSVSGAVQGARDDNVADAHRGDRARWLSPKRAVIGGALLLAALPLWTLPVAALGGSGFLAYLGLSHVYYAGARKLFGAELFPAHEFGIVPNGAAGVLLAAGFYAAMGAAAAWTVAAAVTRWRSGRTGPVRLRRGP